MMTTAQIERALRIRAAGGQAADGQAADGQAADGQAAHGQAAHGQAAHGQALAPSGNARRPRRAGARLWALLHAQGLLSGTAGSRCDVSFVEDDRRRMSGPGRTG